MTDDKTTKTLSQQCHVLVKLYTYSLCTRWLRKSCVTCSCQAFLMPVAEMGAAVGRLPNEPTADPSDNSWLRVEETRWDITYDIVIFFNKGSNSWICQAAANKKQNYWLVRVECVGKRVSMQACLFCSGHTHCSTCKGHLVTCKKHVLSTPRYLDFIIEV